MPLAGALCARFGCRKVIIVSSIVVGSALPLLATFSTFPLLVISLLIFGAGMGTLDVSVNVQAIMVERASGRAMMSGFHGLFSLGGIAGAAAIMALLWLGCSPLIATLSVAGVIAVALALSAPALLPYGSKSEGTIFALPRGSVLFFGIICFIVFMVEGAVLDWSAVFLTTVHHMETSHAGLGYAAFAFTMTLGRFSGDRMVQRFGGASVTLFGALCAAAGVLTATLVSSWQIALLGYALVGIGCSNIAPVMFSSVGRQKDMPESVAVPAITTLGYAGILIGPAAIGLISHLTSLSTAFAFIAALLLAVAISARFLRI